MNDEYTLSDEDIELGVDFQDLLVFYAYYEEPTINAGDVIRFDTRPIYASSRGVHIPAPDQLGASVDVQVVSSGSQQTIWQQTLDVNVIPEVNSGMPIGIISFFLVLAFRRFSVSSFSHREDGDV